jgi:hypothetical protein
MMIDLHRFNKEILKYSDFCDFCVFDIFKLDKGCTTKVYRLGSEFKEAKPIGSQNGTFRRIMYVRLHNV